MSEQDNQKKRLIDLWEEYDENHPSNSYLRGDAEFAGPVSKRKCTDVLFLVVFIILNLGLSYVSYYVINEGAPERLSRGHDFRAAICGTGDRSHLPYMYWPDPYVIDFAFCIEDCPTYFIKEYYCVYDNDHSTLHLDWCWDTIQSTKFGYYCVPVFEQARKEVIDYLFEPMQLFKRSVGDLTLAWDTILAGMAVSVGVAFTILIFFRFRYASIGLMTLCIISNQVLLLYLIYLIYTSYKSTYDQLCNGGSSLEPEYCYKTPSDTLLYILFGVAFLTVLYPIVILFKIKTIKLSIGIIKLATQPFHTVKQIFFYPLMQLLLGSVIFGFLLIVIIYTMSTGVVSLVTGDQIPGGKSKIIEYSATDKYYLIYNVVMTIWWIAFLVAFSEFVLSAAVSVWYFTRERSFLYFPLWRGFKLITKFHMGSVVRGSLLSTLFKLPRIILAFYKSLSALCRRKSPGCTDCLLRCCFCMTCHQKWLRYFSKYSYIFLALFGENYFQAAQKSFYLINRNSNRIFVPAKAGDFGMFIVKLTITLAGTVVSLTLLLLSSETPEGQKTSTLVAPIFVGFVSFLACGFVSEIFGGSMQACMNTIIICGACDEEMFTREQRYMYKELQDYLDNIYEEMTEQQKEHKEMLKMKATDKVYKKTRVADEAEATSVMKVFNQKGEVVAPIQAINVEDVENEEDENVFALSQPRINIQNVSHNVSYNASQFLQVNRDPVANSSFRQNLESGNRSFNQETSKVAKEGPNDRSALLSPFPINRSNRSVVEKYSKEPNSILDPIHVNRLDVSRNHLQPDRSYYDQNRSLLNLNQSVIEANRTNPNNSFLSQNRSFVDNNRSFQGEIFSQNRSFVAPNRGTANQSREEIKINSNSFFDEKSDDAIRVDNNVSIEVEPDDSSRPRFK